jgi:hypothetical protein
MKVGGVTRSNAAEANPSGLPQKADAPELCQRLRFWAMGRLPLWHPLRAEAVRGSEAAPRLQVVQASGSAVRDQSRADQCRCKTGSDDTLIGGDGDDVITDGRGSDTALLGSGNDTFVWNPGDGSDVVEGQEGTDTLVFNGANVNENISIAANHGRVKMTRDVGNPAGDPA